MDIGVESQVTIHELVRVKPETDAETQASGIQIIEAVTEVYK